MPHAVLFDLDRVLIDSRRAWRYALEEAVASTSARRIDAQALVDEYQFRPWNHVLSVVLTSPEERSRCEQLCAEVMRRSAMKKLLVYDGIGMALDSLRSARVGIGAVSRGPHQLALKQAQSTGLDRFLNVLAPTPADEGWDAQARFQQCLRYLETPAHMCAAVAADRTDGASAEAIGLRVFRPGWLDCDVDGPVVTSPEALLASLSS